MLVEGLAVLIVGWAVVTVLLLEVSLKASVIDDVSRIVAVHGVDGPLKVRTTDALFTGEVDGPLSELTS